MTMYIYNQTYSSSLTPARSSGLQHAHGTEGEESCDHVYLIFIILTMHRCTARVQMPPQITTTKRFPLKEITVCELGQ